MPKFLDGVNETIALMTDFSNKDGNADRYVNLLKEQCYLTNYMPQQMDEYMLTLAVRAIIDELGSNANMGQVMAALKAKHAGQYDGKVASNVVKNAI